MRPVALWLPFVVPELAVAVDFWENRLGLRRVDAWSRDGERGVVLQAACGAVVEFVEPGVRSAEPRPAVSSRAVPQPPVTVALELATWDDVDNAFARLAGPEAGKPVVHKRGHYGFTLQDPNGIDVLVWSEQVTA